MHERTKLFGLLLGGTLLIALAACQDESGAPSDPDTEGLSPAGQPGGGGEPDLMAAMLRANDALRAQGLGIAAEAIEYFTLGAARPSDRIHAQPFRWVPNDPRRLAQGTDITYIVDQSEGKTFSGLTNAQPSPRSTPRSRPGTPRRRSTESRSSSVPTPTAISRSSTSSFAGAGRATRSRPTS